MVELTALLSRSGRAIATILNVPHCSTARFSRGGGKCYIYYVDNLLLFPIVLGRYTDKPNRYRIFLNTDTDVGIYNTEKSRFGNCLHAVLGHFMLANSRTRQMII